MNDQKSFERFLSERFDEFGPGRPMSNEIRDDLRALAREARQRPRWLALIEESPMRTNSHLAVGSPMARVAAMVVATMLLLSLVAGASIAGARLLASDGAIVVAQDGSGDFTTIAEAVASAEDDDTVLVRPGTYVEAFVIEADITLSGDGPVEEIIVEAPEGGPTAPTGDIRGSLPAEYALLLQDSEATVSGLTFRGESSRVHAKGGSPVLKGLVLVGVDKPHVDYSDRGGVLVTGGSRATVRDSLFEGGNGVLVYDRSEPLIAGNTLRDGASIGEGFGDGAIVRGNDISGAPFASIGFRSPTGVLIEGNSISGSPTGIWVDPSSSEGSHPRIHSNSITGCNNGIVVGSDTAPIMEGNTLTDNEIAGIALSWGAGTAQITDNDFVGNTVGISVRRSDPHIEGNTMQGGAIGVVIDSATPTLTGNTIEGATESGVRVGRGADPILSDNRICDNGTNLVIGEGAEPVMEGNDICPDQATPSDR